MLKQMVHIVKVTQRGQKIQFQIRLPQNAKRIIDLKITADAGYRKLDKENSLFPLEVGWVWLRLSELRDVFYCDSIKQNKQVFNHTFLNHKPVDDFGRGSFWTQGMKEQNFDITAELDTNLLEGFYVDRYPRRVQDEYQVRIYFTIETYN